MKILLELYPSGWRAYWADYPKTPYCGIGPTEEAAVADLFCWLIRQKYRKALRLRAQQPVEFVQAFREEMESGDKI